MRSFTNESGDTSPTFSPSSIGLAKTVPLGLLVHEKGKKGNCSQAWNNMFQLRWSTYARYNFVENIWITNARLTCMEKRCLRFMLGSIDLHIYDCRRCTVKLMQLCGWNNLLVIRILSRISIEECKNRTWLIPENSQSVPYVLISNDSTGTHSAWRKPPVATATARDRHRLSCLLITGSFLYSLHTLFPKSLGS